MIHTDLDQAFADLDSLDPQGLARDILTDTAERSLKLDQHHPHRGWRDVTGELHDSFVYSVDVEGGSTHGAVVMTGENTATYAALVEARDGVSILRAFDSGRVLEFMRKAFREHDKDVTL